MWQHVYFLSRSIPEIHSHVAGMLGNQQTNNSSCSQATSLGFTILGEMLAYVTVFNPTIEVVTFCLCGWCMLGVFLLLAFTHLEYECQYLLSPCDEMHVHRLDLGSLGNISLGVGVAFDSNLKYLF